MTRRWDVGRIAALLCAAITTGTTAAAGATAAGPSAARNIGLCAAGDSPCNDGFIATMAGNELELDALVTDAAGTPVADVPVEFREEGPASFTSAGDSIVGITGAGGRATVTLFATEGGPSSVTAEISPPGTAGGFRGPATHDDECERPSEPDGDPGAGNCIAGPLNVHWEEELAAECEDGVDNDGDGYVDLEDPQCDDPSDVEGHGDPIDYWWPRSVAVRFVDPDDRRLVVFGRIEIAEGAPRECYAKVRVTIARKHDGAWQRVARPRTDRGGWYAAVVPDRRGAYRASIRREERLTEQNGFHVCMRGAAVERHRHDR